MADNLKKQRIIAPVDNRTDKYTTYKVQMSRYQRAMRSECYLEALMIDYACFEDRLRYMMYYLGILRTENQLKFGRSDTDDAFKTIIDTWLKADEDRVISHIAGKRNIIKAVMLMINRNLPDSKSHVQIVLCKLLAGDNHIQEILNLFDDIEDWCAYRNEVVHSLLNKKVNNLDDHLAKKAEWGFLLFRRLDNLVRWVQRKKIRKQLGLKE